MQEERKASGRDPASGGVAGDTASLVLVAALATVVVYMTWVGLSGEPLPRWLLWATTVL